MATSHEINELLQELRLNLEANEVHEDLLNLTCAFVKRSGLYSLEHGIVAVTQDCDDMANAHESRLLDMVFDLGAKALSGCDAMSLCSSALVANLGRLFQQINQQCDSAQFARLLASTIVKLTRDPHMPQVQKACKVCFQETSLITARPEVNITATPAEPDQDVVSSTLRSVFERYDFDQSGTINSNEELNMMCINGASKLNLMVCVKDLDFLTSMDGPFGDISGTSAISMEDFEWCFRDHFKDHFPIKHSMKPQSKPPVSVTSQSCAVRSMRHIKVAATYL